MDVVLNSRMVVTVKIRRLKDVDYASSDEDDSSDFVPDDNGEIEQRYDPTVRSILFLPINTIAIHCILRLFKVINCTEIPSYTN